MASKLPKYEQRKKLEAVFKPHNDNIPTMVTRMNVAAKTNKAGPSSRYGQQTELRDQNQLLAVANEELHIHLTETKLRVDQLEQQNSDLQGENADVQKRLKECHVLLIAGKINPVLGERIGETTQHHEDQRREVLNVSRDLLSELRTFGDVASDQSARLEDVQKTMKDLTEAREQLMQERENFSLEVEEMEKALEEAEKLLLE